MLRIYKITNFEQLRGKYGDHLVLLSDHSPRLTFSSKKRTPVNSMCWYHVANEPLQSFDFDWWWEKLAITDKSEAFQAYTQFNNLVTTNTVPTKTFEFFMNAKGAEFGIFDNIVMGMHTFQSKGEYIFEEGRGYV